MTRIFLTLASVSTVLMLTVFVLGLNIDDPKRADSQSLISWHLMLALTGLVFAALVHALVLTYFMGTGRWMEDVTKAYQLDQHWRAECARLKYRVLPAMTLCLLLLILTVGFGAAADPASRFGSGEIGGWPISRLHFGIAIVTVVVNLFVNVREFHALERNGKLIKEVTGKVREIRVAKGLPV